MPTLSFHLHQPDLNFESLSLYAQETYLIYGLEG